MVHLPTFAVDFRLMNRTKDAVIMLERCLMLNSGYTAAYLLLAKLHTGSQTGRLLKHVAMYQPKNPEHQARYARWLRDHREYSPGFLQNRFVRIKIER